MLASKDETILFNENTAYIFFKNAKIGIFLNVEKYVRLNTIRCNLGRTIIKIRLVVADYEKYDSFTFTLQKRRVGVRAQRYSHLVVVFLCKDLACTSRVSRITLYRRADKNPVSGWTRANHCSWPREKHVIWCWWNSQKSTRYPCISYKWNERINLFLFSQFCGKQFYLQVSISLVIIWRIWIK